MPADLNARARAVALLVGWRGGVVAGWAATELLVAHCAPRDAPVDLLVDLNVRVLATPDRTLDQVRAVLARRAAESA